IDQGLMDEVAAVQAAVRPHEILLVADAMTGQDAVNVAEGFKARLPLTGIVLTRVDGDSRGGGALSMRAVTGCPIKLIGTGETMEALEDFHPDRIAGRILGMGDVVSLVEKAAEGIQQDEAEALARKMQKGEFDLNDMAKQLGQMRKMGGIKGMLEMLPGVAKAKAAMAQQNIDDKAILRQEAIISSMTREERVHPKVIHASRKKRIAAGSGTSIQDVNKLLKQFMTMKKMMKRVNKMGKKGLMRHGIEGLLPRM
ncbi:MAG: signal recognition particle protein, partial [Proteobacteria bacterium]|nr:signal recognition particle protein [Pseudomonadota bacterium]